jgi:hypothetical protein
LTAAAPPPARPVAAGVSLACDEGKPDVAQAMLALLVAYANECPHLPTGSSDGHG